MALKNIQSNQYIIISLDGRYIIYKDEKARQRIKKATSHETILKKYTEICNNLLKDSEQLYYNPSFPELQFKWFSEFQDYIIAYDQRDMTKKFPLMKNYIKDIEKTIPQIIAEGQVGFRGTKIKTVEEAYNYVKQHKIFGETEDI